ncbi:spore coat protein [Clostridium sp. SHJSY1]|uniref:spore coat protein n=1 Tax=Clostridium sp. SHJSY1 TaxID=2942483 RepID=UPI00287449E4|nr:spore coat protein [Clostridium sp. SHJSY1]MDS0524404.1 spore coat protein [Clostridium sp. SHJSY1]
MLGDKEMTNEILTLEKNLASLYQLGVQESSTDPLRYDFNKLLNQTLDRQNETFKLMQQKGWYKLEQVPQTSIDKVKNKFAQVANPL